MQSFLRSHSEPLRRRGSFRYPSNADSTRFRLPRKTGSSAASTSLCSSMRLRNAFGLWPTLSQSCGSSRENSSRVCRSQLYSRLLASSSSRARRLGSVGLTSRLNVVPMLIGDPEAANYQEIPSSGNSAATTDCERGSKHVTRKIFALCKCLQLGIHVSRIDDHDLALLPVRVERNLCQQLFDDRIEPARADVLGLLVDLPGDLSHAADAIRAKLQSDFLR